MAKDKTVRQVHRIVGKTIRENLLIGDGDNILIGLSGGKDSLVLTDLLHEKLSYYPIKFKITAACVLLEDLQHEPDLEYLNAFCSSRSIQLVIQREKLQGFADATKDKCFLCSWFRRKALFNICEDRGFNKLALGHNLDDVIQTTLMNILYQGNVSTMPANLGMFEGKLKLIRPLSGVEENLIRTYSIEKGFKSDNYSCPFGKEQSRDRIRKLINDLAEENPKVRSNIYGSLKNIRTEYL